MECASDSECVFKIGQDKRQDSGQEYAHLSVCFFLPARRYASAVFATATCPSVCPSITRRCSSQLLPP